MRKFILVMVLSMLAVGSVVAKYQTITATAAAGATSLSITNSASIRTYEVLDVYLGLSAGTTATSTVTMTQSTGGVFVFIESAAVASNGTGAVMALADKVVQQDLGSIIKFERPATATNSVMTAVLVIEAD